jgi:hypothetical protein
MAGMVSLRRAERRRASTGIPRPLACTPALSSPMPATRGRRPVAGAPMGIARAPAFTAPPTRSIPSWWVTAGDSCCIRLIWCPHGCHYSSQQNCLSANRLRAPPERNCAPLFFSQASDRSKCMRADGHAIGRWYRRYFGVGRHAEGLFAETAVTNRKASPVDETFERRWELLWISRLRHRPSGT